MALTAYPAAGEPVRASVFAAIIGEHSVLSAVKSIDESITSNAVLQHDDHLTLPLEASAEYLIRLLLTWTTSATPSFKQGWTLPSGASGNLTGLSSLGSPTGANVLFSATTTWGHNSGAAASLSLTGRLVTTSAGTLIVDWAQATSNGASTTVHAGSSLTAQRLS